MRVPLRVLSQLGLQSRGMLSAPTPIWLCSIAFDLVLCSPPLALSPRDLRSIMRFLPYSITLPREEVGDG